MAALLAALTAAANECQAATQSVSDEHASHGLAVAETLRAIFLLRLAPAQPSPAPLAVLPVELVSVILSHRDTPDISLPIGLARRAHFTSAATAAARNLGGGGGIAAPHKGALPRHRLFPS